MKNWKDNRKMIKLICEYCGGEFKKTMSEYNRSLNLNRKHYCSIKCNYKAKKSKEKTCKNCGVDYKSKRSKSFFCSKSCSAIYNNKGRVYSDVTKLKMSLSAINHELINEYSKKPKKCKQCNGNIQYDKKRNIFCSNKCRKEYGRINMSLYQKYYQDCKFNFSLNKYPNEFDFTLIEKYGWYSPINKNNNIDGVSRDHIYSIKEAYDHKISSSIIKHPANCQLLKHCNNISKNKRSDITINELKEKIKQWDIKYNI